VALLALLLLALRKIWRRRVSARWETGPPPVDAPVDHHASKPVQEITLPNARALHKAVWIHYGLEDCDSDRLIVIHEILGVTTPNGFEARRIEGFCRKSRIRRTFLVERIAQASDADTGELIEDFPTWVAALASA
jgi:hypothetical protein